MGQRLNALMFRGLTRIDENLNPQPDLAESWGTSDGGLAWRFRIRRGLEDHGHQAINAPLIAQCFTQYFEGRPPSPFRASFPNFKSVEAEGETLTIRLSKPDPYLLRNISLLRYFRLGSMPTPCTDPSHAENPVLVGSGPYWPSNGLADLAALEDEVTLVPVADPTAPKLRLLFVQDETTRTLKIARGEVDAAYNALSWTKSEWVRKNYGDRYGVLEREGVKIAYLAFNLRDPDLSKKDVRRAVALALDREEIIRSKGFLTAASGFLSPLLPEFAASESPPNNPTLAEQLLEQAGYPRDPRTGIRLKLHYKCTPAREGLDNALLFQRMLRRVGLDLVIDVVEPAVFFASIRKGNFQLYSSRWLGVADGSILYQSLYSKNPSNRGHYQSTEMDALLETALSEPDFARRKAVLKQAQLLMAEDVPYLPLWFWNNALLIRKDLTGLEPKDLSLSGALDCLTKLRYR